MKTQLLKIAESNGDLRVLIERNKQIVSGLRFSLAEYKTDINLNQPDIPHEFKGNLYQNGFLYIHTKCYDVWSYPSGIRIKKFSIPYPKKLQGTMDFLGNTELIVTELGFRYFLSKRTIAFSLTKSQNGEFFFEASKFEYQTNANEYSTHFLADPFSRNEVLRREFMKNIEKMKDVLRTNDPSLS